MDVNWNKNNMHRVRENINALNQEYMVTTDENIWAI